MTRVATQEVPLTVQGETADVLRLTVNGELRAVRGGATVADLLHDLQLDPRQVIVEHNREIVRDRHRLAERALAAGDVLEVVHFVGGG